MSGDVREPVPPLEKALLAVTALHLIFLPWALGTMHVWSQLVSLVLALAGFTLSLLPPQASLSAFGAPPVPPPPFARLKRFPGFWCGLALLAYIAIQGLNPDWRYATDGDTWWLDPLDPIAWLPRGMDVPFSRSNPWRALVIFGSLWLLVCSIWCGFRHRRSLRMLVIALAANTFCLSFLGVLQQATETKRIFWSYLPSNDSFAASFIYRNHAGAYLNLMVALLTGFAWWQARRSQSRLRKSSPAGLYAVFALFAGLMVVLTSSRASILLLVVFALLLAIALGLQLFRQRKETRSPTETAALVLCLLGLAGATAVSLQVDSVRKRFSDFAADPAGTVEHRTLAREAATEMLSDRWLLGWGAGCFRHGFPIYSSQYPAIYVSENGRIKFWEHAHNDLLEFPIEFGALGMIPIVGVLVFFAVRLIRLRFWENVFAFPVALGCGLLLAHAGVDFVLQCPAVLLTWGALLVCAIRWLELERPA